MAVLKSGEEGQQLFVSIPGDLHSQTPPREVKKAKKRKNKKSKEEMTETDMEVAEQLLQLSNSCSSYTSCHAEDEESENNNVATSATPKNHATPTPKRTPSREECQDSKEPSDRPKERHLTARDTTDVLEHGARRRYKPISAIYESTTPLPSSKSVKKRKFVTDMS